MTGMKGSFPATASWNCLPAAFSCSSLAALCQALMAASTSGTTALPKLGPLPLALALFTKSVTTSIGTGQR